MPRSRRFMQCDVFSPNPTQGNGLAVVVDGEGLSTQQMQQFAAWTNLAETTFLLPPEDPKADYRVRIFTPVHEMPFAGHPTLGSCAAWLRSGGSPKQAGLVRQECAVGLVDIDTRTADRFAFRAPPTRITTMDREKYEAMVEALGIPEDAIVSTACLDNGPVWQAFLMDSAEAVLALEANRVRFPTFRALGFIGPHETGAECDYEVRMLAPSSGFSEDPITGSLNAALGHWLRQRGELTLPGTVAQGTRIGRHGRVYLTPDNDDVWVGGQAQVLINGMVML